MVLIFQKEMDQIKTKKEEVKFISNQKKKSNELKYIYMENEMTFLIPCTNVL